MFENTKDGITRKFRDLKMWVSDIQDEEPNKSISYGLFFVYIYGIYEETIREVIFTTIEELNKAQVKIDDCIFELYAMVFSSEYDGLYNVGNEHKWEKRWIISNKFIDNQIVNIPCDLFPTDGKNIRYKQLESIAKSFGVKRSILPRNEIGGYIQEMVNNRDYIAHGNKLPKEIGRDYTVTDLQKRCEYISEVCTYTVEIYEEYIMDKKYLRSI